MNFPHSSDLTTQPTRVVDHHATNDWLEPPRPVWDEDYRILSSPDPNEDSFIRSLVHSCFLFLSFLAFKPTGLGKLIANLHKSQDDDLAAAKDTNIHSFKVT